MIRTPLLILFLLSTFMIGESNISTDICQPDEDCLDCHILNTASASGHFGTESGGCSFCHATIHVENAADKIEVPQGSDCTDCHVNNPLFSYAGPHEGLTCIECHSPHASEIDPLLLRKPISLCSKSCHASEQLGRSHPVGVGIIDVNTGHEMTCISTCHRMHKPNSENLLVAAAPGLCFSCHGEKF